MGSSGSHVARRHWLAALVLVIVSAPALADGHKCTCDWQGPFSWLTDDADAVIVGKVLSHKGNSMDLSVERVLKGKEYRGRIRIWGRWKNLCQRAKLSRFPDGSQWMFALSRIDKVPRGGFDPSTPDYSYGRKADYVLNRCGAYWLKVHDGKVSGNITSIFKWDYAPEMNPVPIDLIQAFIDGRANYADIIGVSGEITSGAAMMRHTRRALGEDVPDVDN